MHKTNTRTGEGMKEARLLSFNQPEQRPDATPQNPKESNIFVRQENERADMFEDKYDRVYDRMEQRLGEYRARTEELTASLDDAYEGETEQEENADDAALQQYSAAVERYASATRAAYTRMESGMYAKLDDIEANYGLAEAVIAQLDAALAERSGEPVSTYQEEVRTRRVEQTLSSGSVKSVDLHTSKDNFRSVDVRPSTYLVRLPSDFKLDFVGSMPPNAATLRSASNGVQYLALTEEGAQWLDGKTVEMTTGTGETVRAMVSRTTSEYGNVVFTFEKPAEPESPPEPPTAEEVTPVEAPRPEPAEVPEVTPEPPATEEVPLEDPQPEPTTEEANESTEALTQKFVNAVNELELRAMGDNKDYVSKQLETVNNILQNITNPDQKMIALEAAGLVSSSPNSETGRTERTATPRTIIRSLEGETAQTPVTIGTNIDFNAVFLEYGETQESVETLKENLSEAVTQLKNFLEGGYESQANNQVNAVNAAYKEIPTEISAETIAELGLDVGVEADGSMNSGNVYVISLDAKTNTIGYAVKGAEQASEESPSTEEEPPVEAPRPELEAAQEAEGPFDDVKDSVENLRQMIYSGMEPTTENVKEELKAINEKLDSLADGKTDALMFAGVLDGMEVTNEYNDKTYVIGLDENNALAVTEKTEEAPEAVDEFADLKSAVENLRQQIYGGKEVDDASVVDALRDVNDAFTAIPAEMDRENAIDAAGLRDGVEVKSEYNHDKTYAIAYDTATDSIVLKDVTAEESPPEPPANEEQGDTPESEEPAENIDQELTFARNRFNIIKGMLDEQKATFDADGTQKSLDTFRDSVQDAIANRRAQIAERVEKGVDPANDPVISELRDQIISLQNDYLQPYAGKSGAEEQGDTPEDTDERTPEQVWEDIMKGIREDIRALAVSIFNQGPDHPETQKILARLNTQAEEAQSQEGSPGDAENSINVELSIAKPESLLSNDNRNYSVVYKEGAFAIEDVTPTPPNKPEEDEEEQKEEEQENEEEGKEGEQGEEGKESSEVDPEMKEMFKKIQEMLDALMKMMEEMRNQQKPAEGSGTPPENTPETPENTPETSPKTAETAREELKVLKEQLAAVDAEWAKTIAQGYDTLKANGGLKTLDELAARGKDLEAQIAAKEAEIKALESKETLPEDVDALIAMRKEQTDKFATLGRNDDAERATITKTIEGIDGKLRTIRTALAEEFAGLGRDANDRRTAIQADLDKIDAVLKTSTTPDTPPTTPTEDAEKSMTDGAIETALYGALFGTEVSVQNGVATLKLDNEAEAQAVLNYAQTALEATGGNIGTAELNSSDKTKIDIHFNLSAITSPVSLASLVGAINLARLLN